MLILKPILKGIQVQDPKQGTPEYEKVLTEAKELCKGVLQKALRVPDYISCNLSKEEIDKTLSKVQKYQSKFLDRYDKISLEEVSTLLTELMVDPKKRELGKDWLELTDIDEEEFNLIANVGEVQESLFFDILYNTKEEENKVYPMLYTGFVNNIDFKKDVNHLDLKLELLKLVVHSRMEFITKILKNPTYTNLDIYTRLDKGFNNFLSFRIQSENLIKTEIADSISFRMSDERPKPIIYKLNIMK